MPTAVKRFSRPANTTAYTAADVIGAADSVTPANAGSALFDLHFGDVSPDRGVIITGASLLIDANAVPSGMAAFRLHLYSSQPDPRLDNDAFALSATADKTSYLGYIDFTAPVLIGSVLFTQVEQVNLHRHLSNGIAWAQLQTIGAWTPAGATAFRLVVRALVA